MNETLTFLKRSTTDKEGNPLMSKQGKPYTRLSIKVESKGDRFISGFGNQANADWKVGDDVDITITEAEAKDKEGRPYLNFSQPKPGSLDTEKIDRILENTETILNRFVEFRIDLETIKGYMTPKRKDYPQESNVTAFDEPEDEPDF